MTMSAAGFTATSVDDEWFVPHFEKMLYIRRSWRSAILRRGRQPGTSAMPGCPGVFDIRVCGTSRIRTGGFYSAEDADSEIPESGDPKPETHSRGTA